MQLLCDAVGALWKIATAPLRRLIADVVRDVIREALADEHTDTEAPEDSVALNWSAKTDDQLITAPVSWGIEFPPGPR